MCGIYGMLSLRGQALRAPEQLDAMGRSLAHRGPDGRGVVRREGFVMGCERLRIIDLHERADQPFGDPGGRCWVACNGEIYNAGDLRRRYRDYPYRSHSDVETILPLYLDKGIEGLCDLDGMFGLAIWDEPAGTLTLARDRAGEKPLFVSRLDGELWFASEVQALLLDPAISRELDETAVFQYLAMGYVPEPRTAFRDVRKIEAGTFVSFTARSAEGRPGEPGEKVRRYWDPGAFEPAATSAGSALRSLRSLLPTAVEKQLTADVPIGVFVSGGIDSSTLSTIAARAVSGERIHTFTARFTAPSYDESRWAAGATGRLGTHHHEVIVDESSMTEALGGVTEGLAEPLADPAILPTWLLAREARQHVTAILSGEGADELFGGYPTYIGHKLVPWVQVLPGAVRRMLRSAVEIFPASRGKVTLEFMAKRFLADAEKPWLERHVSWFGAGAHRALRADRRPDPAVPILDLGAPAAGGPCDAMLLDYRTYLPDNLLVKNDRATMLHSLEARAPFLDRDLSAFALALPERFKIRGVTTKWLLKKVAREWLPRAEVERRKRGLSVPIASWLDRGLRPEVERLFDAERLARQDLFDPQRVERLLGEHRAGKVNHARPLWTLVMFQYWLERWAPERAG
jgi:asparagine synthase (glutamine-hydrolysing)